MSFDGRGCCGRCEVTEEQAKTATLDELRDWLAGEDGWKHVLRHTHASGLGQMWWQRDNGDESFDHPHPPTLDGAAAALPEGWDWSRLLGFREWYAAQPDANGRITGWGVTIPDTGNEIAARYRLAVLCRLAEKAVEK